MIGRSSAPGVKSANADVGDSNELGFSVEHKEGENGDLPDMTSIDETSSCKAGPEFVEVSHVGGFTVEQYSTDDFTPLISRRIIRDMSSGEQVFD